MTLDTLTTSPFEPSPAVAAAVAAAMAPPPPLPPVPALAPQQAPQALRTPLQRLRSVLLLGGAVRQSEFRKSIGRSILDLPLGANRTLLDLWREQVVALAEATRWDHPNIRLLIDRRAPVPASPAKAGRVDVTTQLDRVELRGTGGLLRDIAESYDDDDYLFVASAAQVICDPLMRLAAILSASASDVAVAAHDDDSPSGLALIRCGALRVIRKTGYVDFKEQALPVIAAAAGRVTVSRMPQSVAMPVRSLQDFIAAMRSLHGAPRDGSTAAVDCSADPFAEAWSPVFSLVEDGADVHRSAEVYDSVVLRGGRVDRNAVIVRSVVCPGGVVAAGQIVTNRLVTPARATVTAAAVLWRCRRHSFPELSDERFVRNEIEGSDAKSQLNRV